MFKSYMQLLAPILAGTDTEPLLHCREMIYLPPVCPKHFRYLQVCLLSPTLRALLPQFLPFSYMITFQLRDHFHWHTNTIATEIGNR